MSDVLVTLTDVEPAVRLNARLEAQGLETAVVSPLDDVKGALKRETPEIVVMTGALLDPPNLHLVRQLLWEEVLVVGLADVDEPGLRDRLRRLGYAEVWVKPIEEEEVADGIRRILERHRLQKEVGLVGDSDAIREVLVKIDQIAPVSSTVLIEGESGTGKELVARAIHRRSLRRNKPFIAVNVGALPETLLESELFGHEKGAFTGAAERRIGRFELASTGTLFLDEIGEIPQATQVKLLRVLEEREVVRVGGTQPIRVDVRVVAATNQPLRQRVEEGGFRADLYFRLNVLRIYLPPLRERREDIPALVRRFVRELSLAHDREFHGISAEAMEILQRYDWPGNVRELRNLIESMVVLSPGREIVPEDIPRAIREGGGSLLPVPVGPLARAREDASGRELEFILRSLVDLKLQVEELRRRLDEERVGAEWLPVHRAPYGIGAGGALPVEPADQPAPPHAVTIVPGMTMQEIERLAIEAALKETDGNRRRAAELLGIGERTLYRKLKEYQLEHGPGSAIDVSSSEVP
jgi:DNA-binding NtrC family response regulator